MRLSDLALEERSSGLVAARRTIARPVPRTIHRFRPPSASDLPILMPAPRRYGAAPPPTHTGPTFRSTSSVRGLSGQTCGLPAGTVSGEWVWLFATVRGGSAATCGTPASWAAVGGQPWTNTGGVANSDMAIFGFRRQYDGVWAMPSVSWGGDGANNATLWAISLGNVDATTQEDVAVVATIFTAYTGSQALTGLTTVTDNSFVFHLICVNLAVTAWTTTPDTNDLANVNRGGAAAGHLGLVTPAGATGTKTYASTATTGNGVGIMLAVRSA